MTRCEWIFPIFLLCVGITSDCIWNGKGLAVFLRKHGIGLGIVFEPHRLWVEVQGTAQPVGNVSQVNQGTGIKSFLVLLTIVVTS